MREKKNILEPEISPVEPVAYSQEDFYKTGNTTPPREHLGFLIFVMLACIFIGGIGGAAAMLPLRSNEQSTGEKEKIVGLLRGKNATDTQPATEPEPSGAETGKNSDDVQMVLADTKQGAENVMQSGGLSLQEIYEKVNPSVVSVRVQGDATSAFGTGIVLSQDGYLITSAHILENAGSVTVTFSDGQSKDAAVVGADAATDLAVLKTDGENLTPAEFGDSGKLRVGDGVVTIGNPLGQSQTTMTEGILCAIHGNGQLGGKAIRLLQTNAIVSDGNTGGPLINCYGQVVGILAAQPGVDTGNTGLGFAIPTSYAKQIVESLVNLGYVPGRPALPLELEEMPAITRAYFRLPEGLYISSVEESSDLWEKGVRAGDMLLSLDDTAVTSQQDLTKLLGGYNVGDQVVATFYHQGMHYVIELTLSEAGAVSVS